MFMKVDDEYEIIHISMYLLQANTDINIHFKAVARPMGTLDAQKWLSWMLTCQLQLRWSNARSATGKLYTIQPVYT